MPAKKPLPREADGTVNIKTARKEMKGHRTNAEIEQRARSDVVAEAPKRIVPPRYLPEEMHGEFRDLAKQLIVLHIFSRLDYDMLARYLMAREAWAGCQTLARYAIAKGNLEKSAHWGKLANLYFGQCHSCAQALGLSITSRCRLSVPQPEKKEDSDPMTKMLRERAERRCQA